MSRKPAREHQVELFELPENKQPKAKPKRGQAPKISDLDPTSCVVWSGNPRRADRLNQDKLQALAASIQEAGQSVPIIARKESDHYEVIAGSRRLSAIMLLYRQNPNITIRAEVRQISDSEAFGLALSENEGRTPLTAFENAISVSEALSAHYHGAQTVLADTLGKSNTWISRHNSIAENLGPYFDLFPDWNVITFRDAYELSQLVKKDPAKFAAAIEDVQSKQSGGIETTSEETLETIRSTFQPKPKRSGKTKYGPNKKPHLIVQNSSSKKITVSIPKYDSMDVGNIEKAFGACLRKWISE